MGRDQIDADTNDDARRDGDILLDWVSFDDAVIADLDVSFACPLIGVDEGSVAPNETFIANPPFTD